MLIETSVRDLEYPMHLEIPIPYNMGTAYRVITETTEELEFALTIAKPSVPPNIFSGDAADKILTALIVKYTQCYIKEYRNWIEWYAQNPKTD